MKTGSYRHLSLYERELIAVQKNMGKSLRAIGELIGRHHTTISRELARNNQPHKMMRGYIAPLANQMASKRKKQAGQRKRLKNMIICNDVKEKLHLGWSPEQIAATMPTRIPGQKISHEAIYQFVHTCYYPGIFLLARRRPKRYPKNYSRKRQKFNIPNRISILDRPRKIDNREQFGHWESDSIESRQSKTILNVLIERQSRYLIINKLPGKKAHCTHEIISLSLGKLPEHARRSITYDNGIENYWHDKTNKLIGTSSYFCQAYHSWEKGAVENANGLIRRFLPKKTNLAEITIEQLEEICRLLNSRPRKCLGFKTPLEVFQQKLHQTKVNGAPPS